MIVTRFAPSPTGLLHLGSAYSALEGWRRARAAGGRFLLRIENIDPTRCTPDYEAAIEGDLAWLGLDWDGPVRRQSAHLEDYRAALDRLAARGLLYPCFCTRGDIAAEIERAGHAPHGPEGPVYPGICKAISEVEREARLAAGEPHALRLHMDRAAALAGPLSWQDESKGEIAATPEAFGDVVLARKETPTSYHLSVTLDDAAQGVTLVTRGLDLFEATHIHRLLQALLDLPTPLYAHHRLLTGADGRRYAKRDRSLTLQALREAGRMPAEVRAMIGMA
ncbi:tRNA glutamyl-Q(34) synthetase GluQRS [Oceanibaculum pacificum]|uniref:Glutamyl-Q tRNA(Asp) synthetase n=1 Tax=Oceanibaculum pacificum TaxID=580166 RepID=A0A154WFI7_9PROT|nr:tRNA glutamyl-Q(34) synthetase GluQRS [Oceanibaculum pacificum]KZD12272.1 glutamyl-Q tRNA(Asp) synthetase [Oceanibaculum pacificum]